MEAVEASIDQLERMPNIGAPRELPKQSLSGLRFGPVKEFDELLIFYLVEGATVRVIRILHGKRDIGRILKKEAAGGQKRR
jgi:plasmid stabilization system protein ParE